MFCFHGKKYPDMKRRGIKAMQRDWPPELNLSERVLKRWTEVSLVETERRAGEAAVWVWMKGPDCSSADPTL